MERSKKEGMPVDYDAGRTRNRLMNSRCRRDGALSRSKSGALPLMEGEHVREGSDGRRCAEKHLLAPHSRR